MSFDAFLKLDGIKGESLDQVHKGEIDVLSFHFGVSQRGTQHGGGGGGAGKSSIQDFHITKKVDSASPLLFVNCATGTHLKEANFVVRKAGGSQLEYLKIKLSDVLISNVTPHGSAEQNELFNKNKIGLAGVGHVPPGYDNSPGAVHTYGDEIPLEDVSLNFARIDITYQPQGMTGQASGGPIVAGYDVKANQKV